MANVKLDIEVLEVLVGKLRLEADGYSKRHHATYGVKALTLYEHADQVDAAVKRIKDIQLLCDHCWEMLYDYEQGDWDDPDTVMVAMKLLREHMEDVEPDGPRVPYRTRLRKVDLEGNGDEPR